MQFENLFVKVSLNFEQGKIRKKSTVVKPKLASSQIPPATEKKLRNVKEREIGRFACYRDVLLNVLHLLHPVNIF